MKIYLVHPGENEFGDLTPKGEWQIKSTARRLSTEKVNVDKVYVNGHNVSRASGDILSKALRVPIVSDERFREIDKKIVLGDIRNEDMENLEFVNLFVDEIVKSGKDAIITIGGGIHRAVISRLTGMPLNETRHFSLLHAGVSVLEYGLRDGTLVWRMTSLNDRSHLRVP